MSKSFDIISPVDGQLYAQKSYADDKSIRSVLERSRSSFTGWKNTPVSVRAAICRKAVEYFKRHADDWGMEITRQMGRPIRFSPMEIRNGFAERADYMISVAEDILGRKNVSDRKGFVRYIKKEPLGTVLVLAPWNYPYLTSVNVVIPAIMAGNCVILKHAEQTALCAERYEKAFLYTGLPEGVFQYIHLTHEQVAKVIHDPTIAYVAFTGSVEGGQAIQKAVGDRLITAGLELGGKDPAYVCEDADIDFAAENLADGAFFNSGQSCCGIERIYVEEKIFEEFVDRFVAKTYQWVLGDPTQPETTLGPMVRNSNAQRAKEEMNLAIKQGATPLIDISRFPAMELPYLPPQVLINVNHQMSVMTKETFAPVVGIMPVGNEMEAIELMNDSVYGLTASIWTRDIEKAIAIGDQVATGTWYMNRCDYLDPELAWTGIKNSGKGCTLSTVGYEHLTRPKSYHLRLPS